MANSEPQSINSVAKKLRLSVHQLRRWELLFGLEIKRGKGQQRQYRAEDTRVLERIKELVDQGWPTSQISQQLETEGLIAPKLIGLPAPSRNSEALTESIIGVRTFCERRLAEIGQQLNEIQQILMSFSLKQHISDTTYSPWQPVTSNLPGVAKEKMVQEAPAEQIHELAAHTDEQPSDTVSIGPSVMPEITDQNYLTVLGKTLDLVGWSDSQADEYSMKNYGVSVWIDLGRSDAEKFIGYLRLISTADSAISANQSDAASITKPAGLLDYEKGDSNSAVMASTAVSIVSQAVRSSTATAAAVAGTNAPIISSTAQSSALSSAAQSSISLSFFGKESGSTVDL